MSSSARTPQRTGAYDTIMARIREALRQPAPLPHLASLHADESDSLVANSDSSQGRRSLKVLPVDAAKPWLPDGGDSQEESLSIFSENSERLKTQLHRTADMAAAATLLRSLISERGWKRVAYHSAALSGPITGAIPCESYCIDTPGVTPPAFNKDTLESCDAGITLCEALVAQTGSIVVSSATCGGRALSILPHTHIVIATADQVTPTLGDALAAAKERHQGQMPSMLGFITGPSRTGDIERILVLGAHGPKELIVIIVG